MKGNVLCKDHDDRDFCRQWISPERNRQDFLIPQMDIQVSDCHE